MNTRITTHILNTTLGKPAAGVTVIFEHRDASGAWKELGRKVTNEDGRIPDSFSSSNQSGEHRLVFLTGEYFRKNAVDTFYPRVTVEFTLQGGEHYHVPLLLSPYGYTTYRGS